MLSINVYPSGSSISVDEGESKVNGAQHLPLLHLSVATTEVECALLQHEVALRERERDGNVLHRVHVCVYGGGGGGGGVGRMGYGVELHLHCWQTQLPLI